MAGTDWAQRFGGVALVTGASSGIGRGFAQALAHLGMDLVLVARRLDRLEALKASLEAQQRVRVHVVGQDLRAPDAGERLAKVTQQLGVDVGLLVLAAGFGQFGSFVTQAPQQALDMVDVNCRAPLGLLAAFLPRLVEKRRGGIIFVSSTAAFQPVPYFATYAATKAFNLFLGEALWAELSPKGIEVLTLCPGYTATEFQDVAKSQRWTHGLLTTSVEQVVDAALFGLGRRATVVPGVFNRLLAWTQDRIPREAVLRMSRSILRPGEDRNGTDQ